MTPAAIKAHWNRVVLLGCLVTRTEYVPDAEGPTRITIHHVHGGSIADRGFKRSLGRKTSDLLVVPIIAHIHTGPGGIDGFPRPPVRRWEAEHRPQADMIDEICRAFGVDLWALARAEEKGVLAWT